MVGEYARVDLQLALEQLYPPSERADSFSEWSANQQVN